MKAFIAHVDYYLPAATLTNEDLSTRFPEWSVEKISAKTGIRTRHIAAPDEYTSDLAVGAGQKLLEGHGVSPASIEYVIVCTQSPDYYLPTTACLVQDRLGIPTSAGATDITLGCSGYIYALGLAKGLIESRQVANVLVITSDTYSKFINEKDKSVRTIFGDGASATLVAGRESEESIYGIMYGTDGSGGSSLIVPRGGLRTGAELSPKSDSDLRQLKTNGYDLYMDGPEIFNFTIKTVPVSVARILAKARLEQEDIDLFVFHQANQFMLEHLRKKLGVPEEKFFISLTEVGNTVSSTIPIALADAERRGELVPGMRVMLMGFGVGLSWGGLVVNW